MHAGTPVQLCQTLDPKAGLVKGIAAIITSCQPNSVQIRLKNGQCWRIPRTTHRYLPSHFRQSILVDRHQLPLAVNFASTIHRAQGDTLSTVLVDLREPVFAHGQLYTAITRTHSRKSIRFLVPAKDYVTASGDAFFTCRNFVFTSILNFVPSVCSHPLHSCSWTSLPHMLQLPSCCRSLCPRQLLLQSDVQDGPVRSSDDASSSTVNA
jgi:hypothetical protein